MRHRAVVRVVVDQRTNSRHLPGRVQFSAATGGLVPNIARARGSYDPFGCFGQVVRNVEIELSSSDAPAMPGARGFESHFPKRASHCGAPGRADRGVNGKVPAVV